MNTGLAALVTERIRIKRSFVTVASPLLQSLLTLAELPRKGAKDLLALSLSECQFYKKRMRCQVPAARRFSVTDCRQGTYSAVLNQLLVLGTNEFFPWVSRLSVLISKSAPDGEVGPQTAAAFGLAL